MLLFFFLLALIVISILCLVIWRAAKKLLEMDAIFDRIVAPLQEYASELTTLSSGELLVDHPEVIRFHRANLRLLAHLNVVIEEVKATRPPPEKQDLPRPEAA